MLKPAAPLDSPSDPAYRVPWRLDRRRAPRFELRNVSGERLIAFTLATLGPGTLIWGLPTAVEAGAAVRFTLHAEDPARDTVVVVRWSRPNGDEYLWRVSF